MFNFWMGNDLCPAGIASSLVLWSLIGISFCDPLGSLWMENLTSSEVAGFGVGALLLCATIAAPKVDAFISASQRSSLGMCKRCGNLRMIACSQCKGVGLVRKGGFLGLNMVDEFLETLGDGNSPPKQMAPCINCRSKGSMPCPLCSKIS